MIETRGLSKISAVARRTGIKEVTLRAWDTRHGVKPSFRDGHTRLYSESDIQRLTKLKRLTETGDAIGQVARLAEAELDNRLDLTKVPQLAQESGSLVALVISPRHSETARIVSALERIREFSFIDKKKTATEEEPLLRSAVTPSVVVVYQFSLNVADIRDIQELFNCPVIGIYEQWFDDELAQNLDSKTIVLHQAEHVDWDELGVLALEAAQDWMISETMFSASDIESIELHAARDGVIDPAWFIRFYQNARDMELHLQRSDNAKHRKMASAMHMARQGIEKALATVVQADGLLLSRTKDPLPWAQTKRS